MKKAIEILEQHVRSYQSMVKLYEANPHNQAITEYTAKEAANNIIHLRRSVAALKAVEAQTHADNSSSMPCCQCGEKRELLCVNRSCSLSPMYTEHGIH